MGEGGGIGIVAGWQAGGGGGMVRKWGEGKLTVKSRGPTHL